jgi:hypothetical protein
MALKGNAEERRKKGKRRKRWSDDVHYDKMIGVERWRTKAVDRGEWRKICEAAKVHQGL